MQILASGPGLSRTRCCGLGLLWAAALFCMALGSIPRWELHQHAREAHGLAHGHHHASDHHDTGVLPPVGVADDAAGQHGHEMPTVSAVPFEAEFAILELFAPRTLAPPANDPCAPSRCWPPPYRPPIA
jgi:hypothetical protein